MSPRTLLAPFALALAVGTTATAQTTAHPGTLLRHLYNVCEHPPTNLGPDVLVNHPHQVPSNPAINPQA